MMYDWRDGGGYLNSGWGWLFMLFMMALFFLGIILVIRFLGSEWHKGKHLETPLDTLKQRYAKGEIDKKEFEEKRKDLMS